MLGTQLQQVRQSCQLTQADVASQLYVTRQTISRWEQGKTMPNIYALQDLAAVYHVSLDELVGTPGSATAEQEEQQMTTPSATHKKINWASAFGLFWFDLLAMLAVVLTVIGLLFGLWVIIGAFIVSPVLVVIAEFAGWLAPEGLPFWWQFVAAAAICGIGVAAWRPVWRLTQYLGHVFMRYLRYHKRSIYPD